VRFVQVWKTTGHAAARLGGYVGFVAGLEVLLRFGGVQESLLPPSASPVAASACC
jgi:hypothetical protein